MEGPGAEPEGAESVLSFDPAAHVYCVDGVPVEWSVTQLLEAAGISPDYSKVNPAVLQHARRRGIHVDACCDLDDSPEGLDWSTVHPEAVGYVQAWQVFKREYGYRPLAAQLIVYHPEYGYAGTTDCVGLLDDYPVIVERKATAKMAPSYALQTAGYAADGLWIAPPGGGVLEPVPWVTPARLGVHLMPGGRYNVYPYENPDDVAAWLGVLALARWRKAARGR